MQLLIWKIFFSIADSKDHKKQFSFSWQSQQYTYIVLPQEYMNSAVLCHNIIHTVLDHLSLPYDITLLHFIDESMWIESSEQ